MSRLHPVRVAPRLTILLPVAAAFVTAILFASAASATVVTDWNNAALAEVRLSKALRNGPPIVARALAIAHTCMYDAWAAYDPVAVGTVLGGSLHRPAAERTDANKAKAISFAAYRCLLNLYPDDGSYNVPPAPTPPTPSARLRAVLVSHGYDPSEASTMDPATPAGIGNIAAQAVIDAWRHDGSNQYADQTPAPCPPHANADLQPLPCAGPGGAATGPYADYIAPHYDPYVPSNPLMGYCTPQLAVCPAADAFIDPSLPWPNVADKDRWQPLVFVNHARQTFIGAHWERVTPFALTSADQFDGQIPRPDFLKNDSRYRRNVNDIITFSRDLDAARKLIVEYWADGPDSELPPGHWGLFAQFVSQRDHHTIDQDVKMFFAMNASFDAGIVGWHIKRKYNGVRPITAIRDTKQGQFIRAWGGPGRPTEDIPGEKWMPYNPGSNLTPGFPGYYSGHSTFSRASAEILRLFTDSDAFGFSTVIPANFGRVEPGIPAVPTTLSYATFSDAANEAGLSRLYGGIHFSDDNTNGQAIGLLIAQRVWAKAQMLFNGTAP